MLGVIGMLPPFKGLDPEIARRTVVEVARHWHWDKCWGWDFPWMAMAAARVGEPNLAIELCSTRRKRIDTTNVAFAQEALILICRETEASFMRLP